MFPNKNIIAPFLIFVYINFINIAFVIVRLSGLVLVRPLIVYDYFLIAILIAIRIPSLIVWICFVLILLLDITQQVSAVFLFSVPEMIRSLEFSSLYQISTTHYLLIALFLLFLFLSYRTLHKIYASRIKPLVIVLLFFSCFAIIHALDYYNGGTGFNSRKTLSITKLNIGGSSLTDLSRIILDLLRVTPRPNPIPHSLTFDTFATDSTGNQLLIILESWGLPDQTNDWEKLKERLSNMAKEEEWNISINSTSFKGGTTHAELRELLKVEGEYYYFLKKDSAEQIVSIFNLKKKQGYSTTAAHSFSGKMFERKLWWKNIGIDTTFFLEDGLRRKEMHDRQLNYATPFTSLNDEDAFSFLNHVAPRSQKKFSYLLTENTHLAFYQKSFSENIPQTVSFENKISAEANNQLKRIQELLFFFIKIDKNQWSKVLIVGDHMPPFTKESDRRFYSKDRVPFLILSKPEKISVTGTK